MKRIIKILLIVGFLIGVCIWEEVSIDQYLSRLETQILQLETKVQQVDNIDSENFLFDIKELEDFWLKKESTFCVILNHKEVEVIGEEIARAMGAVINNSKEDFVSSLVVLKFYVNNLAHIMGLSWQNVI